MMRALALLTLGVSLSMGLTGCGGKNDGSGGSAHPDANCGDFCALLTNCVASLCEEDLGRSFPEEIRNLLERSCSTSCTDELIRENIAPKWDCFFENSCRAIFADDVCQADSSYHCSG
jgi:hypothetical protein